MSATQPSSRREHGFGPRVSDPQPAAELSGEVPRLPRTYVPNSRLADTLDRTTMHAVTMIVGPVGMGKTLGVAGWIRHRRGADGVTWLTVNEDSFPERIAAAFDRARSVDPASPFAGIVVLDDAHRLQPAAFEVINDRMSERRSAGDPPTVILLARRPLPLDGLLPDLSQPWDVVDIGPLRCAPDEADQLISRYRGSWRRQAADLIIELARGWPAGLAALATATIGHDATAWTVQDWITSREVKILAEDAIASLSEQDRELLYRVGAEGPGHGLRRTTAEADVGRLVEGGLFIHRTGDGTYAVHPLLASSISRRLQRGGPDVDDVRAAVVRTVRDDLARGVADGALQRLEAVGEVAMAADLLATHGVRLALGGQAASIGAFADNHPGAVIAQPAGWVPIALERWRTGDTVAAGHWMQMIMNPGSQARPSAAEGATVRLLRSRIGTGSIRAAADHGQRVVDELRADTDLSPRDTVMLPVLLTELGITQNWLGDLTRAEANLTASAGICRTSGWPQLERDANSHLAFTEYLLGREQNCRQLAAEILGSGDDASPHRGFDEECTRLRAGLALVLTGFLEPDPSGRGGQVELRPGTVHEADLSTRFWFRIAEARLKLADHLVAEASQILTRPINLPMVGDLPAQLRIALLMETALVAVLAGDGEALKRMEDECRRIERDGESLLLAGFRADLAGDRRTASVLFHRAADQMQNPDIGLRAVALVCEAQLLDVLGESDAAMTQLREAIVETAARRNNAAFRGWSRQGTPVRVLLQRLNHDVHSPWSEELLAVAASPDLITRMAMLTATPRERRDQRPMQPRPSLSARQHEVLRELARGSTYADIAADLFLSENTVKTHVTSLYAKLGVANRSEALAMARALQLL